VESLRVFTEPFPAIWIINENHARVDSSAVVHTSINRPIPIFGGYKFYSKPEKRMLEDNMATTTVRRIYTRKEKKSGSYNYSSSSHFKKTGDTIRNAVMKLLESGTGYIRLLVTLPVSLSALSGTARQRYVEKDKNNTETVVIEVSLANLEDLFDPATASVLKAFYQ